MPNSHELATNLLDLIAFVLITPEVLGPDRAKKIREAVIKVFNDPDLGTSLSLLLGTGVLMGVTYFWTDVLPPQVRVDNLASGWGAIALGVFLFVVLFSASMFLGAFGIIRAAEILENRPLLRQRLLYVGGAAFLAARVIAIWHAIVSPATT